MAEPATIARPYAEALFQATIGAGADPSTGPGADPVAAGASPGTDSDLVSTAAWLDELAALADHPELRRLAGSPKVTAEQMFDLFTQVRQDAARPALSAMAGNFLRTVIANRRLGVLAQVAQQFRALLNRRSGTSDAVVYSAFALDSAAMSEVGAALQKRFGRKLDLTLRQDPSLIGGIRVVVGDEVLDSSVKARLEQMKAALTA